MKIFQNVIFTLLIFLVPCNSIANQGTYQHYPLPVNIEKDIVPTKCYLYLNVYSYHCNASEALKNVPADSCEHALKMIIQAIKTQDMNLFQQYSHKDSNKTSIYNLFFKSLSGLKDPFLMKRFELGGLTYFWLKSNQSKNPVVPVLIQKEGDKYLQSFKKIAHPLCQNISALCRAIAVNGNAFHSVQTPQFNTEIKFPSLFSSTENSVFLRFTGHKVEFPVSDLSTNSDPIYPEQLKRSLLFYKTMHTTLAPDTIKQYANYFSKESKNSVVQFLNNLKSTKRLDMYLAMHRSYRQISYVISSDQFYLMFYQSNKGHYRNQGLMYDLLFDYPDGLKMVNYTIEGSMDSLINWPDFATFFIKNCLNK